MSDPERMQLIATMGMNIANIDSAIKNRDLVTAQAAFSKFIGAVGFLAQEIDELNNANAN